MPRCGVLGCMGMRMILVFGVADVGVAGAVRLAMAGLLSGVSCRKFNDKLE